MMAGAMPMPFFSIIIPTHSRPGQLATCLASVARLDYERDRFEAIVVDDGSETSPARVIAAYDSQLALTLFRQDQAGPAVARNTGAQLAQGEYLAFTDDDCEPAPGWLQSLAARFDAVPDGAVGGHTRNALRDNPYAAASQFIVDLVYGHYNADPDRAQFLATNNLAVPAAGFQAVGGFDGPSFPFASEDRDFCARWLQRGYPLVYAPEAVVYHAHPLTLHTFWRQHFSYGRGAWRFHRACARRGSRRLVRDLSFHRQLPGLVRRSYAQAAHPSALRLGALLLLWQVANLVGFVWEGLSEAVSSLPQRTHSDGRST